MANVAAATAAATIVKHQAIFPSNASNISTGTTNATLSLHYPVVFWVFLSIENLIIIVGNAVVVHLFLSSRLLRKTQSLFIISLCTSDLLVGVAVAPCEYCACCSDDVKCPMFCGTIISFNMIASVCNLVVICTDRYISIKRPYFYVKFFTRKRSLLLVATCWTVSVFLTCLPVLWIVPSVFSPGTKQQINVVYAVILFIMTIISGVVITLCYCDIIRIIWKQQSKDKERKYGGVMVCIISSLVFGISWIPYTCVEILFQYHVAVSDLAGHVAYFILLLSPCVDPIIYAYYRKDIRGQMVKKYSYSMRPMRPNRAIVGTVNGMMNSFSFSKVDQRKHSRVTISSDITTTSL